MNDVLVKLMLAAIVAAGFATDCNAQARRAATEPIDAAEVYARAAAAIRVDSPSSSDLMYPHFPPFGAEWDRSAAEAWTQNAEARDIVRKARKTKRADWSAEADYPYLTACRQLANELGDAALYQHLQNDDAGAIESIRDLNHLGALLRGNIAQQARSRTLVAAGIDAVLAEKLLIIAPTLEFGADGAKANGLSLETARLMIDELLDQESAQELLKRIAMNGDAPRDAPAAEQLIETFNRTNAERAFAAMSLACQLFKLDKHRWPRALDELVPVYLPHVSINPWGDGKQTIGYALIKEALPDGADRPLIFNRCGSGDGLAFRIDEPQYAFYTEDGSDRPAAEQHQGGQFRDVAAWTPVKPRAEVTMQALHLD